MSCMFLGCENLISINNISKIDISNVSKMDNLFVSCYSLNFLSYIFQNGIYPKLKILVPCFMNAIH